MNDCTLSAEPSERVTRFELKTDRNASRLLLKPAGFYCTTPGPYLVRRQSITWWPMTKTQKNGESSTESRVNKSLQK